MSALRTFLAAVGISPLARGLARAPAQPAASSAHARVKWQSRKLAIWSTRSGVGTVGAAYGLKDGMQTSPGHSFRPLQPAKRVSHRRRYLAERAKVFTQLTDSQQKNRSPLRLF